MTLVTATGWVERAMPRHRHLKGKEQREANQKKWLEAMRNRSKQNEQKTSKGQ